MAMGQSTGAQRGMFDDRVPCRVPNGIVPFRGNGEHTIVGNIGPDLPHASINDVDCRGPPSVDRRSPLLVLHHSSELPGAYYAHSRVCTVSAEDGLGLGLP